MNHFLTQSSVGDLWSQLAESIAGFGPEMVLCGGIVLMLLLRLFAAANRVHMGYVAIGTVLIALWLGWAQWQRFPDVASGNQPAAVGTTGTASENGADDLPPQGKSLFSGMLRLDGLTAFARLLLLAGAAFVIWLTILTGIPDREDSADFYVLLLGATLGMILMVAANHLLMVYLAVEMASLPSYGMAGFLKGRRQSSEAVLKYVVYGGAASGVMLYGISLLAGRFGTGYLPEVADSFLEVLRAPGFDPLLLTGVVLIFVGLSFKLSAVPFHFWCPDVFEGAAAEVGGFLSVASKAAAVALAGRFSLAMTGGLVTADGDPAIWKEATAYLGPLLAFLGAVTATFGNLAAYTQTNIKRLLAYSTIAHAGYMIMALACLTRDGLDATLIYLVAYLFMNLGAFAIVAFLRNQTGTEDFRDYAGMVYRAPVMTICLAIFLLSLVGLPPLAGFMVKYEIFAALYRNGQAYHNNGLFFLLIVGLANTVFSLFYYVRVLKVMIIQSPPAGAPPLRFPAMQTVYALLLAFLVTAGLLLPVPPTGAPAWDALTKYGTQRAVQPFRNPSDLKPAPVAHGPAAKP